MHSRVFYAACMLSLLLRIEWGIVVNQLPIYVYELGASPIEISLVFTVFAGIMIFTLPLWGYCSDYLGKRKLFMVLGMIGLSPIFLIMSLQSRVIPIILLRGSTAIFVGAVVPATWSLVSDITKPENIGRRMGLLTSFEMAGFAIGPIMGGIIADVLGFTVLWVFVAAVCLVGGLIFLVFGSDPPDLSRSLQKQPFKFSWEKSSFRKFSILFIVFSAFLLGIALLGPNRNVYLFRDLGMNKTMVGCFDFIGIISLVLLQPLVGSFSDKHGRKPLMNLAALSLIAGLMVLYFAKNFLQAIPSAILMANYNSYRMAASAYISDITKREERGSSLGLLNSVESAVRSSSAILGGLIITATDIHTVILLSTIFPAISIPIALLALKEPERKSRSEYIP